MKVYLAILISNLLAGAAYAQCEGGILDRQRSARSSDLTVMSEISNSTFTPQMISFKFDAGKHIATNFSCSREEETEYSTYTGYAWVINLPKDPMGDVISVRDRVYRYVGDNEEIEIIGDNIVNIRTGGQIRVESTIDFFLQNATIFPEALTTRLLISGPFWQPGEFGERAIGIVKGATGEFTQPYKDFSAHHVLCFVSQGGIDLIDRSVVMHQNPGLKPSQIDDLIQKMADEKCRAAIQVGPTFFEKSYEADSDARTGVSGLSRRPGRRNIITAMLNQDGTKTYFIMSTISSISSFDTMVLIEKTASKLSLRDSNEDPHLLWSVGLQDDRFLSGPVLVDGAHMVRLTDTDKPTGALILLDGAQ